MLKKILFFSIIVAIIPSCKESKIELNNEDYSEIVRWDWNIEKTKIKVYEYGNIIEVEIIEMPQDLFESIKTYRRIGEARKIGIRSYDEIEKFKQYETFRLVIKSEEKQNESLETEIDISEFAPMKRKKNIVNNLNTFIGLSVEDNEVEKLNRKIGVPVKEFIMLEYFNYGFSFLTKNNKIDGVILYNRGVEGYNKYRGKLPFQINFDDDLSKITQKIEEPMNIDKANRIIKTEKAGVTINYDKNNRVSTIYLKK